MPTLPSGAADSHEQREVAESFGADAQRYDRARPSYPTAMVQRIVAASPGRDMVDVGCGTGIASRQFQAAGCTVLGVEVDQRMAELARRSGLEVDLSSFETWDAAGRSFDAVLAGQSWHWVDPVAGAARAAQVLRPGGRLALFWNVFLPQQQVGKRFAEVYRRVLPDMPHTWDRPVLEMYSEMLGKAEDGMRQAGGFAEAERWRFDWQRVYTRDEWLDTVPTFGGHNRLPAATSADLLAGLGAAIDAVGGSFTMDYATVVSTAVHSA